VARFFLLKHRSKCGPDRFFDKIKMQFLPWKKAAQKFVLLLYFTIICSKKMIAQQTKNRPTGEKSPNLVTLLLGLVARNPPRACNLIYHKGEKNWSSIF
jgi:hypothetical protein